MNFNNKNLPAFANPGSDQGPGSSGLTKRELFAAMAMQGILSNPNMADSHSAVAIKWISEHSVIQADDLLNELEKQTK